MIFVLAAVLLPATARAVTLDTVIPPAPWSGTVGDGGTAEENVAGPGSEMQVRWGVPMTEAGKSGLGFSPFFPPPANVPIDASPFHLGVLRHFNRTVEIGTAATATTLNLLLGFSDPVFTSNPLAFRFTIDETINDPAQHPGGVCPYGSGSPDGACSDRITFSLVEGDPRFMINGQPFIFELLGFGSPGNPTEAFVSIENADNSTPLVARITTTGESGQSQVASPATLMLVAPSLLGMTVLGWRRARQRASECAAA